MNAYVLMNGYGLVTKVVFSKIKLLLFIVYPSWLL